MSLCLGFRKFRLVSNMLLAGLVLAACSSTPTQPPASISTRQPRTEPEPVRPDPGRPVDPTDVEVTDPEDLFKDENTSRYVTPVHMQGRDVKRIAVLLPFSHSQSGVRQQASGILSAIEMAMFDQGNTDILLLPKDTAGDVRQTGQVTREAIDEGADIIIGPLFSDNVIAARSIAIRNDVPVIAFSNSRTAAGGGAYLMSFSPEEEVARVVDWASLNGINRFAFMGPANDYSRRVEAALRFEASRRGGSVIAAEFYDPQNNAPVDEAQRLARSIEYDLNAGTPKVGVVIPDRGVRLRGVAPLMPYYGISLKRIQYLGTSLWDDPEIWSEPVLEGAIYASAPPSDVKQFEQAFTRSFSREPASLSSLGYDAAAMAITVLYDGEVDLQEIQDLEGYRGVNGLFRFRSNGTIDRGLALLSVSERGPKLVEQAPESFFPPVN